MTCNIICNIKQNFAYIQIPAIMFDLRKLKWLVSEIFEIDLKKNNGYIILETFANNSPKIIRDLFLKYHDIDMNLNFLDKKINFLNSDKPLVSCIILLNMNDIFVRDLTIPSIIFNSKDTPIEIIVVNNGKTNIEFDNIKVIESESYNIPIAYNKAASIAKGDYLAFFHDDCFLLDENWINKCIYNLTEEIVAVGPEYHNFEKNEDYELRRNTDLSKEFEEDNGGFLKEVPLVMEKNKFYELGGFPERELLGQEDIFLHKNILKAGKKNMKVDVKNYHFEGISTLLLFSNGGEVLKNLCTNFIFSKNEIIDIITYGLELTINQRINYCITLFHNDLYDPDLSPFCDELEKISNISGINKLPEAYKSESIKTKKILDGSVKVFASVEDVKCLEILNNFVDFNELLFSCVVNKN